MRKVVVKLRKTDFFPKYLYGAGVVAIFGSGTNVAAAGKKILEVLLAAHEE